MITRLVGRIFLYGYVLPNAYRIAKPVVVDVLHNVADKQVATMTAEQKERYDRYMTQVRRATRTR